MPRPALPCPALPARAWADQRCRRPRGPLPGTGRCLQAYCDAYLSILWVSWAFQAAFLAVCAWMHWAKQIHNFRVRRSAWRRTSRPCMSACAGG